MTFGGLGMFRIHLAPAICSRTFPGVYLERCSYDILSFPEIRTWISSRRYGKCVVLPTNIRGRISIHCRVVRGSSTTISTRNGSSLSSNSQLQLEVWLVLLADRIFVRFGAETCDLIDRLLTCNPGERITATQALEHDYFWTDPLPADPKTCCYFRSSSSSFFAHIPP